MARDKLTILGRTIGTFDGWDGDDDWTVFYKFEPVDVLKDDLLAGDLNYAQFEGWFSFVDDEGKLVGQKVDVIKIMNMIQRDPDVATV